MRKIKKAFFTSCFFVSCCKFFIVEIALYHYEQDEAIKESRKEPLLKETLPYYLQRLDAIAKDNNGHLAVGRVRLKLLV